MINQLTDTALCMSVNSTTLPSCSLIGTSAVFPPQRMLLKWNGLGAQLFGKEPQSQHLSLDALQS